MAPDKGHHTGRDPAHQNPSEGQADPTSATILARTPGQQTPPYAGQLQHQAPASLMVGPTPGELCPTQAPTTAGSGDLQPKFDEEACAPLWCKMSVLPSLTLSSATSLGECQAQVHGVPPAALGDQARHRTSLFPKCIVSAAPCRKR